MEINYANKAGGEKQIRNYILPIRIFTHHAFMIALSCFLLPVILLVLFYINARSYGHV